MSEFDGQYYQFAPPNVEEWENLVELSGNPYQSANFDKIETIYSNVPVYFLCRLEGKLVGSIKIYIYESKKLPFPIRAISKGAHVISEPCIHPDYINKTDEIYVSLIKSVEQYFTQFNPVTFTVKTSLGSSAIIFNGEKKETNYGIAYVDLKRNFDEIYATFSSNARQECRIAIKKNVKVEKTDNMNETLKLFDYARTLPGFASASNKHLTTYFNALYKNKMCDVWLARYNNEPVSTVLITKKGKNCFYEYGTSKRTNSGAGYYIHTEIIKFYTEQGFEKYYLGQVATNAINNPKFEKGITFFKKQFNPIIEKGYKHIYLYSSLKQLFWNALCKLMIKK